MGSREDALLCVPPSLASGLFIGLVLGVLLGAFVVSCAPMRPSPPLEAPKEGRRVPPSSPARSGSLRWFFVAGLLVLVASLSMHGRELGRAIASGLRRSASGGGALVLSSAASASRRSNAASPSRAPASCNPLDPFRPGDYPPEPLQSRIDHRLTGRAIYLTVMTANHISVLLENWPSQEEFLYQPFDRCGEEWDPCSQWPMLTCLSLPPHVLTPLSHFLLAVPDRDADAVIDAVTEHLGWEKTMDFTTPQKTYPCEGVVDMVEHPLAGWYRSPRLVTILLVVRNFRLPEHIRTASQVDLAKPCGLLHCCEPDGRGRTFSEIEVEQSKEFSLVNLAFIHHLIIDLPLMDAYDYIFKMDADIRWIFTPRESPESVMRDKHCVIMQSEIMEVGSHLHCVKRACIGRGWQRGGCVPFHSLPFPPSAMVATMEKFAAHHNLTLKSRHHSWCNQQNLYMYGNFVGFWRPFMRAPAQQAFSRWLYENDPKLFNYNDQGATRAYLCMWYDVEWCVWEYLRLAVARIHIASHGPHPPQAQL